MIHQGMADTPYQPSEVVLQHLMGSRKRRKFQSSFVSATTKVSLQMLFVSGQAGEADNPRLRITVEAPCPQDFIPGCFLGVITGVFSSRQAVTPNKDPTESLFVLRRGVPNALGAHGRTQQAGPGQAAKDAPLLLEHCREPPSKGAAGKAGERSTAGHDRKNAR